MTPNYDLLPDYMKPGARAYVEEGHRPGDFLLAIFANDLVGAANRADNVNINLLATYAHFLYNEVPRACWGSKEAVEKWIDSFTSDEEGEEEGELLSLNPLDVDSDPTYRKHMIDAGKGYLLRD